MIGRVIGATAVSDAAMPTPDSASMTFGCDGVFSGRRSGDSCIVGICGRPDGRPGWSPPPPPPGGGGSGSGPGGHHGQQSSGSSGTWGSSGIFGFFFGGRFFPDGFPRRRHWTLADACLAIAGIAFDRLLIVRLLGLLIDRPAAAGLPFTGLSEIGLPALRFVLAGFGVRGSRRRSSPGAANSVRLLARIRCCRRLLGQRRRSPALGRHEPSCCWHHRPTVRKLRGSRPRRCAHANPLRHHPPHASPAGKPGRRRLSHKRIHRFADDSCGPSAGQARKMNAPDDSVVLHRQRAAMTSQAKR